MGIERHAFRLNVSLLSESRRANSLRAVATLIDPTLLRRGIITQASRVYERNFASWRGSWKERASELTDGERTMEFLIGSGGAGRGRRNIVGKATDAGIKLSRQSAR